MGTHMPLTICHSVLFGSKPADAASAVCAPPWYPPATDALSPGPTVDGGGPTSEDSARAGAATPESTKVTLLLLAHPLRRSPYDCGKPVLGL